jgi:hypothetical protein
MRSNEIVQEIRKRPENNREFIRWWRKENDFADYELVDSFVEHSRPDEEIGGYELLDIEQMWQALIRWVPAGLARVKTRNGEAVEWTKVGRDGKKHAYICPFSAETVMMIFDEETGGDVLV